MAVPKAVIATPIDAEGKLIDPEAVSEKQIDDSQSQKFFVVSEGPSFEDQAGFFGRW
jgi:hypothetical protein